MAWVPIAISGGALAVSVFALWRTEWRDRQARRDRSGAHVVLASVRIASNADDALRLDVSATNIGAANAQGLLTRVRLAGGGPWQEEYSHALAPAPEGYYKHTFKLPTSDPQVADQRVKIEFRWTDALGSGKERFSTVARR